MITIFSIIFIPVLFLVLAVVAFCIFFDHAVITRKGTIYRVTTQDKVVALTFDDGPSPLWTPQILDELKRHNVPATFFMIGKHVEKYPQLVKRVFAAGHEIGNHSYLHNVILYYKDEELQLELEHTSWLIKKITGQEIKLFRPPKAWVMEREKNYIKKMGYKIVLWTLNSKDWVTFFNAKYLVAYLMKCIQPGSIILFHDSGGTFSIEGGNRSNTVKSISRLIKEGMAQGYKFVTVSELLQHKE